MKKLFYSLLLLLLPSLASAVTATESFISAPQELIPLIDPITRLEMIEYFNAGRESRSKNILGGSVGITVMNDEMMAFTENSATTHEIAVLPVGSDTVVAFISTYALPAHDSKIEFYDTDWKPLPASRYFRQPSLRDWLTKEGRKDNYRIENNFPFMISEIIVDPEDGVNLTVRSSLDVFGSKEDAATLRRYVKPELRYRWENGAYKAIK